jgi:DNA-binding SARP family transcriptional activator/TolB-like protein/Tfp pilus assembly protein PilF
VEKSVEIRVESKGAVAKNGAARLSVRILGRLTVARGETEVALPTSRKARALLAYLAIARQGVGRDRLCDLLWDAPNDPRGELRWCLSKLRGIFDETTHRRIQTSNDLVAIDLRDCFVDAVEIAKAAEGGLGTLDTERLQSLASLFAGDFFENFDNDPSPNFGTWLTAQRRRFAAYHTAVMERLATRLCGEPDDRALPYLEKWLERAPLDERAHAVLLRFLWRQGKIAPCEKHLETAARLFESEGLDFRPIRETWRLIKDSRSVPSPIAEFTSTPPSPPSSGKSQLQPPRASLAIMPFVSEISVDKGFADGLTHDIITSLARLRDLFIIARGSVFALSERNIGSEDAGRRLNVDYVTSGALRRRNGRITVSVDLIEVRSARILWADSFDHKIADTFDVLHTIGDNIVSAISSEIETVERNKAILKAPNSLNAREAYHRGLWYMYRFRQQDNELARHYFLKAIELDPTFARAYASLSFTHWQSAFQRWGDREKESHSAFDAAGQSLIADDRNPAAHWAMGRALWLRGDFDESLGELNAAVNLSPNFALGHYALSFVHSQSGDPLAAIDASDQSRRLSPFDPLLFGMLGTRAMAHVRLNQFEEAAVWAVKAAARPNAHSQILSIAAHCLALAGRLDEGLQFVAAIRRLQPNYRADDFLASFQFEPEAALVFRDAAKKIGLC